MKTGIKRAPALGRALSIIALLTIGIAPILPASVAVAQERASDNDYW